MSKGDHGTAGPTLKQASRYCLRRRHMLLRDTVFLLFTPSRGGLLVGDLDTGDWGEMSWHVVVAYIKGAHMVSEDDASVDLRGGAECCRV